MAISPTLESRLSLTPLPSETIHLTLGTQQSSLQSSTVSQVKIGGLCAIPDQDRSRFAIPVASVASSEIGDVVCKYPGD
jgi:hypothetical protein